MIVSEILKEKKPKLYTIRSETSVSAAALAMLRENLGALPVSDDNDQIIGLLTRRQLIHAYVRNSVEETNHRTVGELICRRFVTSGIDDSIRQVMTEMSAKGADYTIVVQNCRPVSVLSLGEIIDCRLREAERETQAAERFFTAVC